MGVTDGSQGAGSTRLGIVCSFPDPKERHPYLMKKSMHILEVLDVELETTLG